MVDCSKAVSGRRYHGSLSYRDLMASFQVGGGGAVFREVLHAYLVTAWFFSLRVGCHLYKRRQSVTDHLCAFTDSEVPVYTFRATTTIFHSLLRPSTTIYHSSSKDRLHPHQIQHAIHLDPQQRPSRILAPCHSLKARPAGPMLRKHEGMSPAQSIPKDAHDFTADMQAITNATGSAINLLRN
jgi:hypothetical protein